MPILENNYIFLHNFTFLDITILIFKSIFLIIIWNQMTIDTLSIFVNLNEI